MAKNEVATVEEKNTALVETTAIDGDFVIEIDPADMSIPFLKVVQSLSEEVTPGKEKYNSDVRPGDIYDATTRTVLRDAKCIVCGLKKYYAEWTPEVRGTLLGKHRASDPKVTSATKVAKTTEKGGEFYQLRTIDGNDLIETYGAVLYVVNGDGTTFPAVITLSKTSFMVGKNLSGVLAMKQGKGLGVPIFNLTSTSTSNTRGSWFKPVFTFDSYATDPEVLNTAKGLVGIADKLIFNNSANEGEAVKVDLDNDL